MSKLYKTKEVEIIPLPTPVMSNALVNTLFGVEAMKALKEHLREATQIPAEVLGCEEEVGLQVCDDCGGTGEIKLLTTISECDCQKNAKEKHTSHSATRSEGFQPGVQGAKNRLKLGPQRCMKSAKKRRKTKGSRRRKSSCPND